MSLLGWGYGKIAVSLYKQAGRAHFASDGRWALMAHGKLCFVYVTYNQRSQKPMCHWFSQT